LLKLSGIQTVIVHLHTKNCLPLDNSIKARWKFNNQFWRLGFRSNILNV